MHLNFTLYYKLKALKVFMRHFLIFTSIILANFAYIANSSASELNNTDKQQAAEVVKISAPAMSAVDHAIKQQLQAIRERNDREAYELNTLAIQEEYEDPQSFMRNLRRTKKSLYEHVGYEIIPAKNLNAKFHKVMLTDKFGKSVMAMFKMQQNDNGEWKTNDIVVLTPSDDPI